MISAIRRFIVKGGNPVKVILIALVAAMADWDASWATRDDATESRSLVL